MSMMSMSMAITAEALPDAVVVMTTVELGRAVSGSAVSGVSSMPEVVVVSPR